MTGEKFYITTAIDYANGDPHFGHALEKIGADVIARSHRQMGRNVHFLIGMDEHGQKVAQTAAAKGVEPQAFVDDIAVRFQAMWKSLDISHDQFIRTSDPAHKSGVRAFIKRIADASPEDFYEKEYEGWYCVGCELFKRDDEIVDKKCVLHPTRELQWTKEKNWFFRLSKYQDFLARLVDKRPEFIQPESRRNEIKALIASGLEDLSITRARLAWAIPFPIASKVTGDGNSAGAAEIQGTWVWFDALPNYLTATGYPAKGFKDRWPAMLQAAELALPDRVWGHGFLSFGGERFSKSAGVKIDLNDEIARFGPDAFRYFLMRKVPFDGDGSYSVEGFEAVYTSDLANGVGNLASRVIAMIEKYRAGVVPSGKQVRLDTEDAEDFAAMQAALDGSRGYLLHEALDAIARVTARANLYIQQNQPWTLAKTPGAEAELDNVLAALARSLARQAVTLAAFMPNKAESLWAQLGGAGAAGATPYALLASLETTGWHVKKGDGLFPRPAEPASI